MVGMVAMRMWAWQWVLWVRDMGGGGGIGGQYEERKR